MTSEGMQQPGIRLDLQKCANGAYGHLRDYIYRLIFPVSPGFLQATKSFGFIFKKELFEL